jgi:hypothetical protein
MIAIAPTISEELRSQSITVEIALKRLSPITPKKWSNPNGRIG